MTNAVVLVTGANRGLGTALVEVAIAAGARRVYAGARDLEKLAPLVALAPGKIVPLAIDITDQRSLDAAARHVTELDMLFNNAGVLASYNILASTNEQIGQDMATNFYGTLAATKTFLPMLERAGASGQAALVNILSVVSLASMPALGGYSAAKAAAYSTTQALRGELANKRIAVHAVFPGPIDTDMVRTFDMPKTSAGDVARAIIDGVAQGLDEILPDPTSRAMFAAWKRDPKELERQLASM